jgi:N-acetylmuramic acid 6-phosphate etherase
MIDLGVANAKLRRRTKQILEDASAKDVSAVEHALRQSNHDLRVALVMLKTGKSAQQSRKALAATGGSLRKALGE